jgi:hypothetical protein
MILLFHNILYRFGMLIFIICIWDSSFMRGMSTLIDFRRLIWAILRLNEFTRLILFKKTLNRFNSWDIIIGADILLIVIWWAKKWSLLIDFIVEYFFIMIYFGI